MAHFVPTTEKTTAEGLARLFRDNIWRLGPTVCGRFDEGVKWVVGD